MDHRSKSVEPIAMRLYLDKKDETKKRKNGTTLDPGIWAKVFNHAKGRNFSNTSSMIGDFSRTCAIEGGRLRFMLPE